MNDGSKEVKYLRVGLDKKILDGFGKDESMGEGVLKRCKGFWNYEFLKP